MSRVTDGVPYYGTLRKGEYSIAATVHSTGRGTLGIVVGPPGAAASALLLNVTAEEMRTFALRCLAAAEVLEGVRR